MNADQLLKTVSASDITPGDLVRKFFTKGGWKLVYVESVKHDRGGIEFKYKLVGSPVVRKFRARTNEEFGIIVEKQHVIWPSAGELRAT